MLILLEWMPIGTTITGKVYIATLHCLWRACTKEAPEILRKKITDSSPGQCTSTSFVRCEPVFGKKSNDSAFTSSILNRFGSL